MTSDYSVIHFLVIDESANDLSILAGILRSLGAKVIYRTDDPVKALQLLKTEDIEIAFLANTHHNNHGFKLLRAIRSSKSLARRSVRIVMSCSECKATVIKSAIQSGADGFLAKPLSAKAVDQQIRGLLANSAKRVAPADGAAAETFGVSPATA